MGEDWLVNLGNQRQTFEGHIGIPAASVSLLAPLAMKWVGLLYHMHLLEHRGSSSHGWKPPKPWAKVTFCFINLTFWVFFSHSHRMLSNTLTWYPTVPCPQKVPPVSSRSYRLIIKAGLIFVSKFREWSCFSKLCLIPGLLIFFSFHAVCFIICSHGKGWKLILCIPRND